MIKRIVPEPQRVAAEPSSATEEAEQQPAEQQPTKQRELYGEKGKAKKEKGAVRHGLVFFMSFLGGLLGSGIVAAITAVLFKFVL